MCLNELPLIVYFFMTNFSSTPLSSLVTKITLSWRGRCDFTYKQQRSSQIQSVFLFTIFIDEVIVDFQTYKRSKHEFLHNELAFLKMGCVLFLISSSPRFFLKICQKGPSPKSVVNATLSWLKLEQWCAALMTM